MPKGVAERSPLMAQYQRSGQIRHVWIHEPSRRSEVAAWTLDLPSSEVEQDLLLLRARSFAQVQRGRFDLGVCDAERAFALAEARGDVGESIDAGMDVAYALRERTNWEASGEWLSKVDRLPLTPAQRLRWLNLKIVEAVSHHRDFVAARVLHGQVEDLALKSGDTMALLTSVINRALGIERLTGRYDRMADAAAAIERVYGGQVPAEDEHYRRRILALAAFDTGDQVEESLTQLAQLGDRASIAYADAMLALWRATSGRIDEAQESAERALRSAYPGNVVLLLARLATARSLAQQDRANEALVAIGEIDWAQEEPAWRMVGLIEAAKTARTARSPDLAQLLAEQAIELALEQGSPYLELRARAVLGTIWVDAKNLTRVVELAASLNYGESLARRDPHEAGTVFSHAIQRGLAVAQAGQWVSQSGVKASVVRLIGTVTVVVGGRVLDRTEWVRPRARVLFAYLAYHDRPVAVQRVLDDLWPGVDESAARQSLKVACSYIRRAFQEDVVEWSAHSLRLVLREPYWIDVNDLRRANRSLDPCIGRRWLAQTDLGTPLEDINEPWAEEARLEIAGLIASLRDR